MIAVSAVGIATSLAAVKVIDVLDKKLKVTENLKHGVNSLVKGVKGWFR